MTALESLKRLALVPLLLTSGCVAGPLGELAPVELEGVRVQGYASLETGSLEGEVSGYRLQAQVDPWASSDIDHFTVFLISNVSEGASAPLDGDFDQGTSLGSVAGGPTAPIIIQNLKKNAIYKVRLEAYDASNARIDAASSLCVTTLPVGLDDAITDVAFRVRLKDKEFAGIASTTVAITDGEVVSTSAAEALMGP